MYKHVEFTDKCTSQPSLMKLFPADRDYQNFSTSQNPENNWYLAVVSFNWYIWNTTTIHLRLREHYRRKGRRIARTRRPGHVLWDSVSVYISIYIRELQLWNPNNIVCLTIYVYVIVCSSSSSVRSCEISYIHIE